MQKMFIALGLILFSYVSSSAARNVILEFKGAYDLPTSYNFRRAYHNGNALFGPELTWQLCERNQHWHGFISIDYLQRSGRYLGICDATKLRLLPTAIGLKYFIPLTPRVDFYTGLGFQPTYVHTKNTRGLVVAKQSLCGLGGIAKMGTYIKCNHNFVLDLFFDYSFLQTKHGNFYGHTVSPTKAKLNSAIFGIGFGYGF